MVDVSVTGTVRADPDGVFRFLADLENWPRWQSDMKSTALAEGQPGKVGAVYRYLVEPAPEGSRVTLNPRPEVRGIGRVMEPLISFMGRRLNQEHLKALRQVLEKG